jgi:2-polyprenyl-6-methoxyphenol hydroxylase-like FAD-dependent oxidoreductase
MMSKVTRTRSFFWSLLFVATFPNVLEWTSGSTRQSLSLVSAMAAAQSGRRATAVASSARTAETRTKDCVIVGGGPVGLAAARTLAQSPHYYKVTVLEQTAAGRSSVRQYDPTRSYLYNINRRGLTWFNLPGNEYALHQLEERGYAPTEGEASVICRIPADPKAPILPPKAIQVANVASVSGRKNNSTAAATTATFGGSYWIPRHETVDLLMLACEEQNDSNNQTTLASAGGGGAGGSITILPNKMVKSLVASHDNDNDNDGLLTVQCTDGTSVTASLVVAADGIDSTVRSILAGNINEPAADRGSSGVGWLQSKARSFRTKKYRSPATGLRVKALQFPPNFTLTNVTGEIIPTRPDCFYSFRGAHTGSRNYVNIGMLPLKRVGVTRPGNLIAPYDHELWRCQNGSEVKAWIEKCFPRVNWNDMIPDANEWERFAKAKATVFPYCQYSPGSAVTAPGGTTGVVLVGDACTYLRCILLGQSRTVLYFLLTSIVSISNDQATPFLPISDKASMRDCWTWLPWTTRSAAGLTATTTTTRNERL